MDGKTIVRIIETILSRRGISKSEFYEKCGVSSATFSQWRTGVYNPTQAKIEQIEKWLEIDLSDYEKSDTREDLRADLRILLHSASDLPPSSVYALISQIEKMKEDAT